jgi:hypothetical protein
VSTWVTYCQYKALVVPVWVDKGREGGYEKKKKKKKERIAYSLVDLGAGFLPDLAALRLGVGRALRDLALDLCCDVVRVTWGWVVRIGDSS